MFSMNRMRLVWVHVTGSTIPKKEADRSISVSAQVPSAGLPVSVGCSIDGPAARGRSCELSLALR